MRPAFKISSHHRRRSFKCQLNWPGGPGGGVHRETSLTMRVVTTDAGRPVLPPSPATTRLQRVCGSGPSEASTRSSTPDTKGARDLDASSVAGVSMTLRPHATVGVLPVPTPNRGVLARIDDPFSQGHRSPSNVRRNRRRGGSAHPIAQHRVDEGVFHVDVCHDGDVRSPRKRLSPVQIGQSRKRETQSLEVRPPWNSQFRGDFVRRRVSAVKSGLEVDVYDRLEEVFTIGVIAVLATAATGGDYFGLLKLDSCAFYIVRVRRATI